MVEQQVTIQIADGLHMRPAGLLASALAKFESDVILVHETKQINAKSVISLMQAALNCGDSVFVTADGSDEADALACAVQFLREQ